MLPPQAEFAERKPFPKMHEERIFWSVYPTVWRICRRAIWSAFSALAQATILVWALFPISSRANFMPRKKLIRVISAFRESYEAIAKLNNR
jgi:hypothetical protein